MNQTANYQLSQWERTDKIQMDDFNADNAKIDAAIKAEADARAAGDAALNLALDKRGNCQMWVHTYTGNGQYGENNRNRVTFPQKPALIILIDPYTRWSQIITPEYTTFNFGHDGASISWSGNTMSYYSANAGGQLNTSGYIYKIIAFWPR